MTRRKPQIVAVLGVVLTIIALSWWVLGGGAGPSGAIPSVSGQPAPTPHPNCPVGSRCVVAHNWPPFTAIFETNGGAVAISGKSIETRETKKLVWNNPYSWKITTISADNIEAGLGFGTVNATGSYEQQDGESYVTYDARFDSLNTHTLAEKEVIIPEGIFLSLLYSGRDFGTRTDGDRIILDGYTCDGDACTGAVGDSDTSATTAGREFSDIRGIVFSDDAYRIPLLSETSEIEVTELRTNFIPTPTPGPTPTPAVLPVPPLPDVTVAVTAGGKWRLSWNNAGTRTYFAQLRREDGRWAGTWHDGKEPFILMPKTGSFERGVRYIFTLHLRGDGVVYDGWSPKLTMMLYEPAGGASGDV